MFPETASGLPGAATGNRFVAFLSGLVVNPSNAAIAALSVLMVAASLSLVPCLFIVYAEAK